MSINADLWKALREFGLSTSTYMEVLDDLGAAQLIRKLTGVLKKGTYAGGVGRLHRNGGWGFGSCLQSQENHSFGLGSSESAGAAAVRCRRAGYHTARHPSFDGLRKIKENAQRISRWKRESSFDRR
jgi:hypothetical protein